MFQTVDLMKEQMKIIKVIACIVQQIPCKVAEGVEKRAYPKVGISE